MDKELKDWTFEEVVRYSQAKAILAIPTGGFNDAIWMACDLALQWRSLQESKRKESEKK